MSDTEAEKKTGWFGRLKAGLSRSAGQLGEQIGALFTKRKLDREALDELEETLIRADLGIATAGKIVAAIARDRFEKDISAEEIRIALAESVTPLLQPVEQPMDRTGA